MVIDASVWVSSLVAEDLHHQANRRWLTEQINRGEHQIVPTLALSSEATYARTPTQPSDCRTTSFLSTHASLRPTPNPDSWRPCIAASTRTPSHHSPGLEL